MQVRFHLRLPLILGLVLLMSTAPLEELTLSAVANTQAPAEIAPANSIYGVTYLAVKKKRKRRRRSRKYTLRGNPEVTRKVATELIVEHLPDLAELVGLDVPVSAQSQPTNEVIDDSEDPNVAGDNAGTPVRKVSADIPSTGVRASVASNSPDYSDSEFSDEEDPDQLTEDDEQMLAEEEDLTIVEFYDEFTDYMASLNGDVHITDNGIDKILAMETLMEWLGTRYLFGGTSSRGIDCSAFTRMMYGTLGCQLPRTAAMQWDVSSAREIEHLDDLQFGDLVFFHTRKAVYVSHVGMYLGNGMFAHASSRNGVTVSSLESNYYSTHFIGGRRYDMELPTADDDAVASNTSGVDTSAVQ